MEFKKDRYQSIFIVTGGISGINLSEFDTLSGGILFAFLGVVIFFGVYFPIRETAPVFKLLVLVILVGLFFLLLSIL